MAPMRCRSPTNFMRWQHRSVQFEAPQFLSWKIPSSDQQRDTTHLSMRGHSTSSTRNLLLARPTNIVTLFAALPCPAPESFEHYSPTYSGSSAQGNATLLSRRLLPHAIPYPS